MSCGGGCLGGCGNPCATPDAGGACDPEAEKGFGLARPVERGDTIVLVYGPIVDRYGAPIDFTAPAKAWFTIKRYLYKIDAQAEWEGTLGAGIVQETRGTLVVTVPPIVTVNVPDSVDVLYYTLKGMDAAGRIATLEKGRLLVAPTTNRAIG